MRTCVLILTVISLGSLVAQEAPKEGERNRLVFPAGASQPAATPQPKTDGTPSERIAAFFEALKKEQVDAAYDGLVTGTIIAEKKEDVEALKKRTLAAMDSYGQVSGYEFVEQRKVGGVLERHTCLLLCADLPLRWRFFFYNSGDGWKLVDLRVDDGLVELFEDIGKVQRNN